MKVLVAGKGFIGSKIGQRLEKEHEVKYLDRSDADYNFDVTEEFEIAEEFDLLVHTIGLAPGFNSSEAYEAVHVKGTKNIVEAVSAERAVYLSALRAGEIEHSFFQTKKRAEEILQNSEMKTAIIRPSTVYGPGNRLLEIMRSMSVTRMFPDIRAKTQPISLENLVEMTVQISESSENRVFSAAGPEKITIGEMARKIYAEQGCSCILLPAPVFLLKWKLRMLSFLPPPFQKENIELLRSDNTTDRNDASDFVELENVF